MLAAIPRPAWMASQELSCILDVSLSLTQAGLFWTLALARVMPVWLPQSHWSIVEDPGFFARDPRLLAYLTGSGLAGSGPTDGGPRCRGGLAGSGDAGAALARVTAVWREARDAIGFESIPRLYWFNGGRAGSMVPKDCDAGLVDRVDGLAAGFDARQASVTPIGSGLPDTLADCARDTAALAAGLGGPRPIVLTRLADDEPVPELARQLHNARIASTRIEAGGVPDAWRVPVQAALAVSGLAVPLAAGRLRLAAVAIVAPGAPLLPQDIPGPLDGTDPLAWNEDGTAAEAALWDDANAVWWELP